MLLPRLLTKQSPVLHFDLVEILAMLIPTKCLAPPSSDGFGKPRGREVSPVITSLYRALVAIFHAANRDSARFDAYRDFAYP